MILPLSAVAVEGYRSLRRIRFPVGHLTVLVGKNGVGYEPGEQGGRGSTHRHQGR